MASPSQKQPTLTTTSRGPNAATDPQKQLLWDLFKKHSHFEYDVNTHPPSSVARVRGGFDVDEVDDGFGSFSPASRGGSSRAHYHDRHHDFSEDDKENAPPRASVSNKGKGQSVLSSKAKQRQERRAPLSFSLSPSPPRSNHHHHQQQRNASHSSRRAADTEDAPPPLSSLEGSSSSASTSSSVVVNRRMTQGEFMAMVHALREEMGMRITSEKVGHGGKGGERVGHSHNSVMLSSPSSKSRGRGSVDVDSTTVLPTFSIDLSSGGKISNTTRRQAKCLPATTSSSSTSSPSPSEAFSELELLLNSDAYALSVWRTMAGEHTTNPHHNDDDVVKGRLFSFSPSNFEGVSDHSFFSSSADDSHKSSLSWNRVYKVMQSFLSKSSSSPLVEKVTDADGKGRPTAEMKNPLFAGGGGGVNTQQRSQPPLIATQNRPVGLASSPKLLAAKVITTANRRPSSNDPNGPGEKGRSASGSNSLQNANGEKKRRSLSVTSAAGSSSVSASLQNNGIKRHDDGGDGGSEGEEEASPDPVWEDDYHHSPYWPPPPQPVAANHTQPSNSSSAAARRQQHTSDTVYAKLMKVSIEKFAEKDDDNHDADGAVRVKTGSHHHAGKAEGERGAEEGQQGLNAAALKANVVPSPQSADAVVTKNTTSQKEGEAKAMGAHSEDTLASIIAGKIKETKRRQQQQKEQHNEKREAPSSSHRDNASSSTPSHIGRQRLAGASAKKKGDSISSYSAASHKNNTNNTMSPLSASAFPLLAGGGSKRRAASSQPARPSPFRAASSSQGQRPTVAMAVAKNPKNATPKYFQDDGDVKVDPENSQMFDNKSQDDDDDDDVPVVTLTLGLGEATGSVGVIEQEKVIAKEEDEEDVHEKIDPVFINDELTPPHWNAEPLLILPQAEAPFPSLKSAKDNVIVAQKDKGKKGDDGAGCHPDASHNHRVNKDTQDDASSKDADNNDEDEGGDNASALYDDLYSVSEPRAHRGGGREHDDGAQGEGERLVVNLDDSGDNQDAEDAENDGCDRNSTIINAADTSVHQVDVDNEDEVLLLSPEKAEPAAHNKSTPVAANTDADATSPAREEEEEMIALSPTQPFHHPPPPPPLPTNRSNSAWAVSDFASMKRDYPHHHHRHQHQQQEDDTKTVRFADKSSSSAFAAVGSKSALYRDRYAKREEEASDDEEKDENVEKKDAPPPAHHLAAMIVGGSAFPPPPSLYAHPRQHQPLSPVADAVVAVRAQSVTMLMSPENSSAPDQAQQLASHRLHTLSPFGGRGAANNVANTISDHLYSQHPYYSPPRGRTAATPPSPSSSPTPSTNTTVNTTTTNVRGTSIRINLDASSSDDDEDKNDKDEVQDDEVQDHAPRPSYPLPTHHHVYGNGHSPTTVMVLSPSPAKQTQKKDEASFAYSPNAASPQINASGAAYPHDEYHHQPQRHRYYHLPPSSATHSNKEMQRNDRHHAHRADTYGEDGDADEASVERSQQSAAHHHHHNGEGEGEEGPRRLAFVREASPPASALTTSQRGQKAIVKKGILSPRFDDDEDEDGDDDDDENALGTNDGASSADCVSPISPQPHKQKEDDAVVGTKHLHTDHDDLGGGVGGGGDDSIVANPDAQNESGLIVVATMMNSGAAWDGVTVDYTRQKAEKEDFRGEVQPPFPHASSVSAAYAPHSLSPTTVVVLGNDGEGGMRRSLTVSQQHWSVSNATTLLHWRGGGEGLVGDASRSASVVVAPPTKLSLVGESLWGLNNNSEKKKKSMNDTSEEKKVEEVAAAIPQSIYQTQQPFSTSFSAAVLNAAAASTGAADGRVRKGEEEGGATAPPLRLADCSAPQYHPTTQRATRVFNAPTSRTTQSFLPAQSSIRLSLVTGTMVTLAENDVDDDQWHGVCGRRGNTDGLKALQQQRSSSRTQKENKMRSTSRGGAREERRGNSESTTFSSSETSDEDDKDYEEEEVGRRQRHHHHRRRYAANHSGERAKRHPSLSSLSPPSSQQQRSPSLCASVTASSYTTTASSSRASSSRSSCATTATTTTSYTSTTATTSSADDDMTSSPSSSLPPTREGSLASSSAALRDNVNAADINDPRRHYYTTQPQQHEQSTLNAHYVSHYDPYYSQPSSLFFDAQRHGDFRQQHNHHHDQYHHRYDASIAALDETMVFQPSYSFDHAHHATTAANAAAVNYYDDGQESRISRKDEESGSAAAVVGFVGDVSSSTAAPPGDADASIAAALSRRRARSITAPPLLHELLLTTTMPSLSTPHPTAATAASIMHQQQYDQQQRHVTPALQTPMVPSTLTFFTRAAPPPSPQFPPHPQSQPQHHVAVTVVDGSCPAPPTRPALTTAALNDSSVINHADVVAAAPAPLPPPPISHMRQLPKSSSELTATRQSRREEEEKNINSNNLSSAFPLQGWRREAFLEKQKQQLLAEAQQQNGNPSPASVSLSVKPRQVQCKPEMGITTSIAPTTTTATTQHRTGGDQQEGMVVPHSTTTNPDDGSYQQPSPPPSTASAAQHNKWSGRSPAATSPCTSPQRRGTSPRTNTTTFPPTTTVVASSSTIGLAGLGSQPKGKGRVRTVTFLSQGKSSVGGGGGGGAKHNDDASPSDRQPPTEQQEYLHHNLFASPTNTSRQIDYPLSAERSYHVARKEKEGTDASLSGAMPSPPRGAGGGGGAPAVVGGGVATLNASVRNPPSPTAPTQPSSPADEWRLSRQQQQQVHASDTNATIIIATTSSSHHSLNTSGFVVEASTPGRIKRRPDTSTLTAMTMTMAANHRTALFTSAEEDSAANGNATLNSNDFAASKQADDDDTNAAIPTHPLAAHPWEKLTSPPCPISEQLRALEREARAALNGHSSGRDLEEASRPSHPPPPPPPSSTDDFANVHIDNHVALMPPVALREAEEGTDKLSPAVVVAPPTSLPQRALQKMKERVATPTREKKIDAPSHHRIAVDPQSLVSPSSLSPAPKTPKDRANTPTRSVNVKGLEDNIRNNNDDVAPKTAAPSGGPPLPPTVMRTLQLQQFYFGAGGGNNANPSRNNSSAAAFGRAASVDSNASSSSARSSSVRTPPVTRVVVQRKQ